MTQPRQIIALLEAKAFNPPNIEAVKLTEDEYAELSDNDKLRYTSALMKRGLS